MQRLRITNENNPYLQFIEALYTTSFPLPERRLWASLMTLLSEPEMDFRLLQESNTPLGFIISWQLDNWCYIEHLAINPTLQGHGYGSKIISLLLKEKGNLVLETSLPMDEISRRRIIFYERLNLKKSPYPYTQPPYRRGESGIPMQLMSSVPFKTRRSLSI